MDFELSSEQDLMRDAARRMVRRAIGPHLATHDRMCALPKSVLLDILREVAHLGLTAPRLPEQAGGSGISMLDYGVMFEQIPPRVSMSMLSQDACISRIYAEGSASQRARFLPDLIAGRRIGCTGSTEPDTGSDPRGVKTRVTRDGSMLVLNGAKMWITNASVCDTMIVTCLDARRDAAGRRIVKLIVDRNESPFEAKEIDAIGLNQGFLGQALFDNCRVPAENLVDAEHGGTQVLKTSWNVNRPLVGLQAVHLAQRAFDIALEYARTRKAFGKPIGAHQLIQQSLSDMDTGITASRLLCYRALAQIDAGRPADGAAAMAKRYAQVSCGNAVWQAMNVLGAMGLSREAGLEEAFRDIRMLSIPDGTNEILALIHGRELTGLEAFRGTLA